MDGRIDWWAYFWLLVLVVPSMRFFESLQDVLRVKYEEYIMVAFMSAIVFKAVSQTTVVWAVTGGYISICFINVLPSFPVDNFLWG